MNYTLEDIFRALDLRHTRQVREKLWNARVGIGGIGGLGSHTALALARAGIGHLHIVDDDEVDLSNINRQAYFLSQVGKKKTDALIEIIRNINPYSDHLLILPDCWPVS